MPHYDMTTLLAFVFEDNIKSKSLLLSHHFQTFGSLPNVANMADHYQSLVILGYQ